MLKDGGDKEHAVDLATIIAGFLQSVNFFPTLFLEMIITWND